MEKDPVNNDQRRSAMRYAELQVKKQQAGLLPEEQAEMENLIRVTGLDHAQLVAIATNEIYAQSTRH